MMVKFLKAFLLVVPVLMMSCTDGSDSPRSRSNRVKSTKSVGEKVPQKAGVRNVDADKFHDLVESGNGIVLDVRTAGETARGSIEGASFISVNDKSFLRKVSLMQKDKPIYVYCATGSRSAYAAKVMLKNGFKEVYNLNGGIGSWARSGYAVTKPSADADHNIKQLSLAEFNKMIEGDQPVFVDFHTRWCSPCKKMAPLVDQLQKDYDGKVKVLRIDVDSSTEVANHFGIQGVPVFILYDKGTETWRKSGVMTVDELHEVLDKSLVK
jgi:thioredoxin